jgi:hypothetical protein
MDPAAYIRAHGGVVSSRELTAAGIPRGELTRLVQRGVLLRPRQGWYSTLPPLHPRFRAAHIGGRLTGASALYDMGAWMLREPVRVEVAVVRGSSRLRPDPYSLVHWSDDQTPVSSDLVVGLGEALRRVALDHDLETSVPCFDWALHTERLDRIALEAVLEKLPASARTLASWLDPDSESLLESIARVRLMRAGWPVTSQVPVGERQAIDLVIGGVIALELDGKEHHENNFEADRRKDLRITIEGRHSIRATYSMLLGRWELIESAIIEAVRARGLAHLQNSVIPPPEPHGTRYRPRARRPSD